MPSTRQGRHVRIPGLDNVHLTYCLNVHPGRTFAEAETAIFEKARNVFDRFVRATGTSGPFGLGIWLSAQAARALVEENKTDAFARRLESDGFYAFTLNGFPYGRFHGTRVKENVYRPDWADPRRGEYTQLLTRILSRLLPEGVNGSISTLPVTFKPWADDARVHAAVANLAGLAVSLNDLRNASGTEISLAIEPEPGCYLESTDDVIRFFSEELLPRGGELLRREHGIQLGQAEEILRRHLGICLDTTHTAVMCEHPVEAVKSIAANGIRLSKVQLGAALSADIGCEGPPEALNAFKDEVYLHQVMVQTEDRKVFFTDLPDALEHGRHALGEWRVHFHVPLSWPGEGEISTTSHQIDETFLQAAVNAGVSHFELEIYTLNVFPGEMESVEAVMAQDLAWLWERFLAVQPGSRSSRPGDLASP